jgi:hypothetical protein
MPLLIAYLLALAVFLGGSYVGVQWLVAPSEPSAHAESAANRLVNAKKIRDARAEHRRLAESLAEEGPKPAAPAPQAKVETPSATADAAAPPDSVKAAEAPGEASKPEMQSAAAVASDSRLDARADVTPAGEAQVKPIEHAREVHPSAKTDSKKSLAQKPAPAEKVAAVRTSEPAVSREAEAPAAKKEARLKKKPVERIASSSRKPVMMMLRTIEFPDGHREQRLLPMSEARASAPRYGLSAFADDDDF